MSRVLFALLILAHGPAALAQTPEFDAASVKPSAPLVPGNLRMAGAQITCAALSPKDYFKFAFNVKDYQIDGPDWMGSRIDLKKMNLTTSPTCWCALWTAPW